MRCRYWRYRYKISFFFLCSCLRVHISLSILLYVQFIHSPFQYKEQQWQVILPPVVVIRCVLSYVSDRVRCIVPTPTQLVLDNLKLTSHVHFLILYYPVAYLLIFLLSSLPRGNNTFLLAGRGFDRKKYSCLFVMTDCVHSSIWPLCDYIIKVFGLLLSPDKNISSTYTALVSSIPIDNVVLLFLS